MSKRFDRKSTRRFSDRVAYYVRHRPGYPPELLDFLRSELGLVASSTVADIGSGTGKLSEILLRHGNEVFGVEPNREMRAAAEEVLREYRGFHSVAGTAESTGLDEHSVDLIVAAQAFHWFRIDETRREFVRIGKPESPTVLVWNRRSEATPFLRAYESLLHRLSTDYARVDHRTRSDDTALDRFFGRGVRRRAAFPNSQSLDWDGLRGRALSSSYVPMPGQPRHDEMLRELRGIFDRFGRKGRVSIDYETEVHWGRLGASRDV